MDDVLAKMKHAEFLDSVLMRFDGNKSVYLKDLEDELGYRTEQYHLTENALRSLSGAGLITPIRPDYTTGIPVVGGYFLSDKGWDVMVNISRDGFVAKDKQRIKEEQEKQNRIKIEEERHESNFGLNVIILIVAIVTLIATLRGCSCSAEQF